MTAFESPETYFDLDAFKHGYLFESGRVWDALDRLKTYLSEYGDYTIEGEVSPGAHLEGDMIAIGEGTVVEAGATIIGPAVIGRNCTIRQGAYLRGNVLCGDGCIIGHASEAKTAILLDGAKAAHFAYLGDSILGAGVNLGAGTKLANFKMNTGDRTIVVRCGETKINTGRRKLGAILGDGVELGCNSVTMPGTLVGPRSLVYPCAVISGFIPRDSVVKIRQSQEITKRNDS
ncbi:MAG TPA: glucose-1-phosphate thymidylyltransferase [bacterium]|nr:glucose-1-phosphate thymidylyltransferase [bacterium]